MLLKAPVRCWLLGIGLTIGGMLIGINSDAAQAQTVSTREALVADIVIEEAASDHSIYLLPLNPMLSSSAEDMAQLSNRPTAFPLRVVDARWHNVSYKDLQPEEPAIGLSLNQLPIIGELLDEEGNFDWGLDLPVTINLGDVLGDYGVIVGTDFSL